MTTIHWLHYPELFTVMTSYGFTTKTLPDGAHLFRHPDGAEIVIPEMEPGHPVVNYHYGAVQAAMDNYGIMTRDAFELALFQAAHRLPMPA